MTTEKLIEIAKICSEEDRCPLDCPYFNGKTKNCADKLTGDVTYRLERAYTDLKEQGYCSTCKYNNICSGEGDADTGCNGSDKWEWAGDEE